jgi:hypothetical protein
MDLGQPDKMQSATGVLGTGTRTSSLSIAPGHAVAPSGVVPVNGTKVTNKAASAAFKTPLVGEHHPFRAALIQLGGTAGNAGLRRTPLADPRIHADMRFVVDAVSHMCKAFVRAFGQSLVIHCMTSLAKSREEV